MIACAQSNPEFGIFGGRIVPDWERAPNGQRFLDWIPMGSTFAVVDDAFNDVAEGESGRLVVRGPTGCRYWRRPDRQRQYVQHGWNVTGDWCVRDQRIRAT